MHCGSYAYYLDYYGYRRLEATYDTADAETDNGAGGSPRTRRLLRCSVAATEVDSYSECVCTASSSNGMYCQTWYCEETTAIAEGLDVYVPRDNSFEMRIAAVDLLKPRRCTSQNLILCGRRPAPAGMVRVRQGERQRPVLRAVVQRQRNSFGRLHVRRR